MVTLEVHICDQRRSIKVGFATEDQAIGYVARKSSTCAFYEVESSPIPRDWKRLEDLMYPTCDHGLSADLCYGPAHYATDEEIAKGW